jgi:hypothetical protein
MIWLISLLGLAGAASTLMRRKDDLAYLALLAIVPALQSLIDQPDPRYRYNVIGPLLCMAAAFIARLSLSSRPDAASASPDTAYVRAKP